MANITATMVKDLRDKTGAGMMDCKNALNETNGDMEAAIDWLRKKGISKAAKKAGRAAAEGLVGVAVDANTGVLLEVNAETDFVAKNDEFKTFVKDASKLALKEGGNLEKLLAHPMGSSTVQQTLTELVAKIGENMSVRRAAALSVNPGVVAALAEWDIDITDETPTKLTDEMARAADVIITMGCGDACPVYPGKRYQDWELEDPAGRSLEEIRPIRDEILRRVELLVTDLLGSD